MAPTLLLRSPTRVLSCARAILIRVTSPAYRSLRSATRPTTGLSGEHRPHGYCVDRVGLPYPGRRRHRRKECRRRGVVDDEALRSGTERHISEGPVDDG